MRFSLTWKKKIAFSLVLVALLFVTLELCLRLFFAFYVGPSVLLFGSRFARHQIQPNKHTLHTVTRHENSRAGYSKYFPNQSRVDTNEAGETFTVHINASGFRGVDFKKEKQRGVVRIVTLGASSTFGYYARDDETYPHQLEQLLNARGSRAYEVINLGIPHLRSHQVYSLLLGEALPLDPDVVTYYGGANDSVSQEPEHKEATALDRTRLPSVLRSYLITASLADSLLEQYSTRRFASDEVEKYINGKSGHFLRNVAEINEECRKRGIAFVVVTQQMKSGFVEKEKIKNVRYAQEVEIVRNRLSKRGLERFELYFLTHSVLMRDLEAWADDAGLQVVDGIEALDRDRGVLVSPVHLSARGNQLIAEALAKRILEIADGSVAPKGSLAPR